MTACDNCADAAGWEPATGPEALAARVLDMLALVDTGTFQVVDPRSEHRGYQSTEGTQYRALYEIPRRLINAQTTMSGGCAESAESPTIWIIPVLKIICTHCGRALEISWTPERGYEQWVVTDPAVQQP